MNRKPPGKRSKKRPATPGGRGNENKVRIIGGRWRRRKLQFPAIAGLRPTPDRVRETLFNWLQPEIAGARVLDLYCGSGSLGLEALSRGAASCTFVDSSAAVHQALEANLALLQANDMATRATCVQADVQAWLGGHHKPSVDLVFIDPPYAMNLLPASLDALLASGLLLPGSLLYLEQPADSKCPLPDSLLQTRNLRAGNNEYALYQLGAEAA